MKAEVLFHLSDCCNDVVPNEPVSIDGKMLEQIKRNRVVGIAAENISKTDRYLLDEEGKKQLLIWKAGMLNQTEIFMKNMSYLCGILENADFRYALLKGAYLTTKLYKKGCRTSNDIDILIRTEDIGKLDKLLKKHGFVQGGTDSQGNIIPATRKEIIMSRMNYGETVPYVLIKDGNVIDIDVNFSVDYKPPKTEFVIDSMLKRAKKMDYASSYFYTLDSVDFMIHLFFHQFKEAVIYEYFERGKDIMLYKYSDMNLLFHSYGADFHYEELLERIRSYDAELQSYYCLDLLVTIYPALMKIPGISWLVQELKQIDDSYLRRIIDPPAKRAYIYNTDVDTWFTEEKRERFLEEIPWKEEYLI